MLSSQCHGKMTQYTFQLPSQLEKLFTCFSTASEGNHLMIMQPNQLYNLNKHNVQTLHSFNMEKVETAEYQLILEKKFCSFILKVNLFSALRKDKRYITKNKKLDTTQKLHSQNKKCQNIQPLNYIPCLSFGSVKAGRNSQGRPPYKISLSNHPQYSFLSLCLANIYPARDCQQPERINKRVEYKIKMLQSSFEALTYHANQ